MRSSPNLFLALALAALVAGPARAQQPSPTPTAPKASTATAQAPQRPQFRPSVLATGSDSLVNKIDWQALAKKGQKDGAVQFAVMVGPDGRQGEAWTYRRMPGSEALEEEVQRRLDEARFTAPIYNYQPVTVMLYGTVIFSANELPRVRVLLNQDAEEIKALNDFIGPQPVIGGDSKFKGLKVLEGVPVAVDGVIDVRITVDAKGSLRDFVLLQEEPPLLGFGAAAIADFEGVKFIPAFRDGDATDSASVFSICYKPVDGAPVTEPASPLQLGQPAPTATP